MLAPNGLLNPISFRRHSCLLAAVSILPDQMQNATRSIAVLLPQLLAVGSNNAVFQPIIPQLVRDTKRSNRSAFVTAGFGLNDTAHDFGHCAIQQGAPSSFLKHSTGLEVGAIQ